jgi:hypothetical protein
MTRGWGWTHIYSYKGYLNMLDEDHAMFSIRVLACADAAKLVWC